MTLSLPAHLVDPVAGGLLSGIDVDGGPTNEQLKVLRALLTHVWDRPDIDLRQVRHVSPSELAILLEDDEHRTMFHELHMALETCRHPQSAAQVAAVQEYADALGVGGDDLAIFRDLVIEGVESATTDYQRFLDETLTARFEPSLIDLPVISDQQEIELAEKLQAFAEYGPGTLGRSYLSFYERFGLDLPGVEVSSINHFFVSHDMTHTIAGLATTIPGEVALSAFQFAMNNNQSNRAALLASLIAHEAGFAHPAHLAAADMAILNNDSAVHLLGQELRRGSECTGDFSLVDHFELAPMMLADVRAEFGVRPPVNAHDGHHFLW
jgi:hypothetical protein